MFGEGNQAAELRYLRDSLRLRDRVEMPGAAPADQALSGLGVFVLSSYMETSGLALLEAMAAGVPVVASRVGGVPENAPPGTAQLVQAGDVDGFAGAIERLLDQPALARDQAEAAREHVKRHFTAEISARATLSLYERLLRTARPR